MTDYFTDDKKVEIETKDGRVFEKESKSDEPDEEHDRDIRQNGKHGKSKFVDQASFVEHEEEYELKEVRLIYDGEIVALRRVMPIRIGAADTLKITYEFSIERPKADIINISP